MLSKRRGITWSTIEVFFHIMHSMEYNSLVKYFAFCLLLYICEESLHIYRLSGDSILEPLGINLFKLYF